MLIMALYRKQHVDVSVTDHRDMQAILPRFHVGYVTSNKERVSCMAKHLGAGSLVAPS